MDYRQLSQEILNRGKEKMDDLEVFIQNDKQIEIRIFKGEVDKYSISESGGLSLRGIANGKMGYSYTEKLDETSIDMLIDEAYENSKYIDSPDKEIIFEGSDKYEEFENSSSNLANTPAEEKIKFLLDLEREALTMDKRVASIQACAYQEFKSERYIMNTKGVDLADNNSGAFAYISVIVKDGEDTKTGMSFRIFKDLKEVDYKEMAKEAVEEGISMLGASPIKSDSYPIIFKNIVFADILAAFGSIFSADQVQKGLSLLKDKIGEKIATDIFTVVEDPFLPNGFYSKAFDDEGHKTIYKKIIDKGELKTYLYNLKTANKDGVESTGNGSRGSYKAPVTIAPTNVYVEKGDKTLEDLISSIDKGVYIISVQGLHSGLNPVSGDYSLSADGYEIENGKIKRPVNQITIAGNFFETLMDIEAIGNDLEFTIPMFGYIGSPSIKVKKLSVSGE
ncbi:MAG: TldD/PmbA family protein [Tissierellia bacterium]|nr:TldD/PmbA family protein [Tissierellia bacterium]